MNDVRVHLDGNVGVAIVAGAGSGDVEEIRPTDELPLYGEVSAVFVDEPLVARAEVAHAAKTESRPEFRGIHPDPAFEAGVRAVADAVEHVPVVLGWTQDFRRLNDDYRGAALKCEHPIGRVEASDRHLGAVRVPPLRNVVLDESRCFPHRFCSHLNPQGSFLSNRKLLSLEVFVKCDDEEIIFKQKPGSA